MATSSLLMGSYRSMANQTITVNAAGETVSASLAGIYLEHATTALSLIDQVATAIANQAAGGACVIQQNGKVKISASSTFSVTWTSSLLATLLGFSGDPLSLASSYEADEISPLIWIPSTTEGTDRSVIGLSGSSQYDVAQATAPDGTQVTRIFGNAIRRQRLWWRYVPKTYYQTASELGGEFGTFFDNVLVKGNLFNLHRNITFDTSSTSTLTIGTAIGPYVQSNSQNLIPFRRGAGLETVESAYDVDIDCHVTTEYA